MDPGFYNIMILAFSLSLVAVFESLSLMSGIRADMSLPSELLFVHFASYQILVGSSAASIMIALHPEVLALCIFPFFLFVAFWYLIQSFLMLVWVQVLFLLAILVVLTTREHSLVQYSFAYCDGTACGNIYLIVYWVAVVIVMALRL